MKNVIIIGAGELGSRHLQGILKCPSALFVFVVDPNPNSLQTAQERAKLIPHKHKVNYLKTIEDVSTNIDIGIVATTANVREQVLVDLLNKIQIRHLILEKVLFQSISSFQIIGDLLKKKMVCAWVNHPRRMFPYYQKINETIKDKQLNTFQCEVSGYNWGIGCNGLHFIDLCAYLNSESKIKQINCDLIDKKIAQNKRAGFIDFTGSLKLIFDDESSCKLMSNNLNSGPLIVSIKTNEDSWKITESNPVSILHSDKQLINKESSCDALFQSDLSTLLIEDLIHKDLCNLPSYEDACKLHIPFIKALLKCYNEIMNTKDTALKIT